MYSMRNFVDRNDYIENIAVAIKRSPVVSLLGPRQSGKTTLARQFSKLFDGPVSFYDMESEIDSNKLTNAEMILRDKKGLVVIDEIQLRPELFSTLRVVVDNEDCEALFLILGSASSSIIKQASETLAGRVEFIEIQGFSFLEVGETNLNQLWTRGGFPRSFLTSSESASIKWRENFIRTFLERDLPQLGIFITPQAMRRFWTMLAHVHGEVWNASKLASSMSLSDKTMKHYLDILTGSYMVRQLQPWFENLKKRQVKSPKIYLRDSGLLHHLLTIKDYEALLAHPGLGTSWEGFAIENIAAMKIFDELYFWSVHSGAELDLLSFYNGKRIGFEFKFTSTPKVTKSMRSCIELLGLHKLFIVTPLNDLYPLSEKVVVASLSHIQQVIAQ